MNTISFSVPGNPKALKRHRTFRKENFTGTYDPNTDAKSDFLAMASSHKPDVPLDCPLEVEMTFVFDRPKAHFRTGKNSHLLKDNAPFTHTSAPDCDNLAKFVCDALNGIFWKDDRIIYKLTVFKMYSNVPRTEIIITEGK